MKREPRVLIVEAPDTEAVVDFLGGHGANVTLCVQNGRLSVTVRMPHGEDASTWDEHEASWPFPPQSDRG